MPALREAHDRLLEAYGPRGWWPALSEDEDARRVEVMVGAVLTQNTSWKNVERAVANLHKRSLFDAHKLAAIDALELESLIRPAGTFRVKAKRLGNLMRRIVNDHGSVDALFKLPTDELRGVLLAVSGVGPETADAILLYAAGRPVFVVDAYLRRVVERHGWADDLTYDALQRLFLAELPADAALLNEHHALIVEVGKRHCGPTANCEGCPLSAMLPHREE